MNIPTGFSGVISIKQGNQIIFQKALGFADMPNKVPNEINTKFGTASAGKSFVAAAILQLIKEGTISLDSTIGDILSFDLKAIDPHITIQQLLNHTSGIPDYFDESVMDEYEELWQDIPNYRIRTSSDLLPLFIDKPMMYPRGTKFQYNNSGYVVLGLIIEAIEQLPFDKYLQEAIFDPFGMIDTGYYEMDKLPAKCAYAYINDGDGYRTNIYSIDAKGTGAGGAFTTASDVERFWEGLIRNNLLEQMSSPQTEYYGYGLWLGKTRPSMQGSDPGVDFISTYDAQKQLCITILSNMNCNVNRMHGDLEKCI